MFSKRWLILLALLMSLLIAFPTSDVFAQGGDDDEDDEDFPITIEITGTVEEIGEDIIVDGFIIAPAGAFRPSTLSVGDVVTITGTLLDDDTIKADDLEFVSHAEDTDTDEDEDEDDGNGRGNNGNGNGNGNN